MSNTIGIDIGGTKIAGGLVKKDKIIKKAEVKTGKGMVDRIKELISNLLKDHKALRIAIG